MANTNSTLVKEFQKNPENPAIAKEIVSNINVMKDIVIEGIKTINMNEIKPFYENNANEIKKNLESLRDELKNDLSWEQRATIFREMKEQQILLNDITKEVCKTKRTQDKVKGGIIGLCLVGIVWLVAKALKGSSPYTLPQSEPVV